MLAVVPILRASTDFKDVFTPEAANATAYSNSVIGTNTWQWWNKEREEWAVYAIAVTAKQPSEELPPMASIASPVAPPATREPQAEHTDAIQLELVNAQMQPLPQAQQAHTQVEATTALATESDGHELNAPAEAPLAAEQAPRTVSTEESAVAGSEEPAKAG